MGPPSRYNLYAAAHSRAHPAPASIPAETEVDTASLSNTDLVKHHLKLLATAATLEEFSSRAAAAFSRSVNITVNGVHLSRELYAQQWGTTFNASGAIFFSSAMETPNIRIPMLQNAALVGVSYDANFTSSVNRLSAVSGSSEQFAISVSSTINLIIAEDKTLPTSTSDRRRIVSVNQVLVDKDGLVTFPLRNQ